MEPKSNKNQYFEKPLIATQATKESDYDVTIQDISTNLIEDTDYFFRKKDGTFNHFAYNVALINKYENLSALERVDFLIFQALQQENPKRWLIQFDKLITDNSGPSADYSLPVFSVKPEGHDEAIREALQNIKQKTEIDLTGLKKIKTILTVPQIGYLLRILIFLKIIDDDNKLNAAKVFAEIFAPKSKKGEKVSFLNIYNSMNIPNPKDADFWDEKFLHLRQSTKKDIEKITK